MDHDDSVRQLNTEVLIRFGYKVDGAANGAAGLNALRAAHYDLVITDHLMPQVTGIDMIKMIRCKDTDLPVIMTSGELSNEELESHLWLDISAILPKPYTIADLANTVRSVLDAAAKPER